MKTITHQKPHKAAPREADVQSTQSLRDVIAGKKVLIFGGVGFKGSWLARVCRDAGAEVRITTHRKSLPGSSFDILGVGGFSSVQLSITDTAAVRAVIAEFAPDVIYIMSAVSTVPAAALEPLQAFETNALGPAKVLDAVRLEGLTARCVFISTDHVFGDADSAGIPIGGYTESHAVGFSSPYCTSKAAAELIVRSMFRTYAPDRTYPPIRGEVVITRAANVIGEGDYNARRVVPLFIKSALQGEIPLRYLEMGRQFISINDVIAGYCLAGFMPLKVSSDRSVVTWHFALTNYNNGTNYITMRELAELVAKITGAKINTKGAIAYHPGENRVQELSTKKTERELNWCARVSLEATLERLVRYHRRDDDRAAHVKLVTAEAADIVRILGAHRVAKV